MSAGIDRDILRIAAKGDGVTADGTHVAGAVPGDVLTARGEVVAGPHRAQPPCRHFGRCGGCQLQHADEEVLARFAHDRVVNAAKGQDIAVGEVLPVHLSPPCSRRRATLHAAGGKGGLRIGFREAASHRIVDMQECHVVVPEIFDLVDPLRQLFKRFGGRIAADVAMTLTDRGVDCGIKGLAPEGLEETEALLDFAREQKLARLTIDLGYGAEPLWEPVPVTVTLAGITVPFPPGAFLQPTADGEAALLRAAETWIGDAGPVIDLFAGLGTFAFALSKNVRVTAAEAARDAHMACRSAAARGGLQISVEHRDLYRNPYRAEELDKFASVLLDPPRAGAREQVAQIAKSSLGRVVYISCNPASWAKDARQLVDAGFRLTSLQPVGQFRWTTHVELASLFER